MASIKHENPSKVIIVRRPSNVSGQTGQQNTSEENENNPVESVEEENLPEEPAKKETPKA